MLNLSGIQNLHQKIQCTMKSQFAWDKFCSLCFSHAGIPSGRGSLVGDKPERIIVQGRRWVSLPGAEHGWNFRGSHQTEGGGNHKDGQTSKEEVPKDHVEILLEVREAVQDRQPLGEGEPGPPKHQITFSQQNPDCLHPRTKGSQRPLAEDEFAWCEEKDLSIHLRQTIRTFSNWPGVGNHRMKTRTWTRCWHWITGFLFFSTSTVTVPLCFG